MIGNFSFAHDRTIPEAALRKFEQTLGRIVIKDVPPPPDDAGHAHQGTRSPWGTTPPPEHVTTSTVPRPRRCFVWFRHKQAAQALLADIFGDIPRLTAVHEACELKGFPVDARYTWIEVVDHDYVIPDVVHMAAKTSGLVHLTISDKNARAAYSKKIENFCRNPLPQDWDLDIPPMRPEDYHRAKTGPYCWSAHIAPDDWT